MDISATSSVGQVSDTKSLFGQEEMLRLLLAQVSYQDPLKPMGNEEFMAQLAQYTLVDLSNQINEKLDQISDAQSVSYTLGMLGRTAEIATDSGLETGEVVAIQYESGLPVLSVSTDGGAFLTGIGISQIMSIR